MWLRVSTSLLLFGLIAPHVKGLSVHYGGLGASMPFALTYQDVQSPLEIVLQIANDSAVNASVLAWQLDLESRPVNGAEGSLLIHDATAPSDPLFDQTTEPQCEPDIPPASDSVFIQDVESGFAAESIDAQTARNIVQLSLIASPNASGTFQLIFPQAENPETDSSWFDADEFSPKAFENADASEFPGFILLGTIVVTPSDAIGDYDRDGNVDSGDYSCWMETFGTILSTDGDGADGNRDGIVDAADYVAWRAMISQSVAGTDANANVPEAGSVALMSLGLIGFAAVFAPKDSKRAVC
jgi:hypothetical protein